MSYQDKPLKEIAEQMQRLASDDWLCLIKWTCPKCGDRCQADEWNVIHTKGYLHSERADGSPCGGVYTGEMFGLLIARRADITTPPNNPLDG